MAVRGFGKLLDDLKTLEVNTIVKDNITARKMPDPANAILDIAQLYGWYLAARGVPVRDWLATDSPALSEEPRARIEQIAAQGDIQQWLSPEPGSQYGAFSSELVHIEVDTFSALRWAASILAEYGSPRPAERVVLSRIGRNCDDLKNLLNRLDAEPLYTEHCKGKSRSELNRGFSADYQRRELIPLTPDDGTLLRKIWEIGVEDVVAQTTIQLDADVVTRISRQYTGTNQAHILELHRLGIESAVSFWSALMEAVGSFIGNLADALTNRRT